MIEEEMDNGAILITLLDENDNIIMTSWKEKPKKKRTGHRSRYCIGESFDLLTSAQRDALLALRNYVMNDGRIRSRKRTKFGRHGEIEAITGKSMMKTLLDFGVLFEVDGWWYVNRDFLFRG